MPMLPTLRTLAVFVAMLVLAPCIGCSSTNRPQVQWPAVASCLQVTPDEVFATVQAVLLSDGTEQSTLSDRAVTQLEDLAVTHGPSAIACLVDRAVAALSAPTSAPATAPGQALTSRRTARSLVPGEQPVETLPELHTAAAARGRNFLAHVGTQVRREAP